MLLIAIERGRKEAYLRYLHISSSQVEHHRCPSFLGLSHIPQTGGGLGFLTNCQAVSMHSTTGAIMQMHLIKVVAGLYR